MPSTVVHVAFAGLVGTALLADHFDARAVLVVMAATAFVDLDVFVGFWIPGAHRAAFHTLVLPALVGAVVWADVRRGPDSRLRSRWGAYGVRVAWVGLVAVSFAGIALDAFFNGANLLYPIHDRFYELSGEVFYSTTEGFVQTLVNVNLDALVETFAPEGTAGAVEGGGGGANGATSGPVRTTENTHYSTGVDPSRGAEAEDVERLFPIAMTGERALLALTGYVVVGLRVWEERRRAREE